MDLSYRSHFFNDTLLHRTGGWLTESLKMIDDRVER